MQEIPFKHKEKNYYEGSQKREQVAWRDSGFSTMETPTTQMDMALSNLL